MAQSNKAQSNRNPSKKDSDDFSDDPSDSDSSPQQQPHDEQSTIVIEETTLPISTATNEEDYLKEIQFLRLQLGAKDQKIISLEQRLKAAQRQCIRLENMGTLPQNNNLPAVEGEEICLDVKGKERVLRRVLPALTHQKVHPRTNNRIIAKRIAGELFCAEYFGGHLKTEFMLCARIEIRTKIYTPVKVLKMMDLKGGQVNFEAVVLEGLCPSSLLPTR
jgi:hypothetical protein